ncbi:MAG TPA: GH1 family beta-glucosidase [Lacipirellulaceae bacterium]
MAAATFPTDFIWGAATSAYQIEGSPLADGAGASIWHRFAHQPGKIQGNDHGDIACDHYRRFADDIALMRVLGIQAYRFSISWSRVLPQGTGTVNQRGLDFYRRLVDLLLEHQVRPSVTLYHWDLPQALEDRGGWAARDMPQWFAEYARTIFRALGDRVPQWATINEPWVVFDNGYVSGQHAPGRCDWAEAGAVSLNLLRAHGAAVDAFRSESKQQIGLVVNLVPIDPATDLAADRQAASRMDAYLNRHFLDPMFLGQYPEEMREMFGPAWPAIEAADAALIQSPIDFVGINYYLRLYVADNVSAGPPRARIVDKPNCPRTATGWEIHPAGLIDTLRSVRERYGDLPLYIMENGAAMDDVPEPNGGVVDTQRVEYIRDHLRAARQAIGEGVNLRGYFVWSLLDNFEWHSGFSKRFGIVRVDYPTQQRIPKSSARFFSSVIRTNGAAIED